MCAITDYDMFIFDLNRALKSYEEKITFVFLFSRIFCEV